MTFRRADPLATWNGLYWLATSDHDWLVSTETSLNEKDDLMRYASNLFRRVRELEAEEDEDDTEG